MLKHSNKKVLNAAAIIAHQHHERYDGKGYPQGLRGEEIHIYGRITALADVFDALCSDRVYKKAWELDRVIDLLRSERGKHFDPVIVDLFLNHLDEFVAIGICTKKMKVVNQAWASLFKSGIYFELQFLYARKGLETERKRGVTLEGIGLVLEGGGMRGVYTAGVLEYFMGQDLYFPYVVGVSAGACNAVSYISKQPGRNKKVTIGYIVIPIFKLSKFITSKSIFGMDFIFNELPNRLVPFDYDTFYTSSQQFAIGTTDAHTGEPIYFTKQQLMQQTFQLFKRLVHCHSWLHQFNITADLI